MFFGIESLFQAVVSNALFHFPTPVVAEPLEDAFFCG